MESQWNPVPTDDEIKTYRETETDYMPTKKHYEDPINLNLRKLAVTEIAKKWMMLSVDDAFVPYLAMNYFDNFVSHIYMKLSVTEAPRVAIACLTIAARIRETPTENFPEDIFEGFYTREIKAMEFWFRKKGERLKQPVTPFCFVNYYYPAFRNIKRCCIDEIIIQAQGEEDFIGYKPSDIAFSSFLAATRIANPLIAIGSVKLPDGLNRCDEELYHLYHKKGIRVEISMSEAPPSLIATVEIPKEQPKEAATSEIETKIEEATPSLIATVEIPKGQPEEVATSEIEEVATSEFEEVIRSLIATVEISKEQPKEVATSEIEEIIPSLIANVKIPKELPEQDTLSTIEEEVATSEMEEVIRSLLATEEISKEQPKEVATSEIEEVIPSLIENVEIPKEQPEQVTTSEIEEVVPSLIANVEILEEQPQEVSTCEIEEVVPSLIANVEIPEEELEEVATSESETESAKQRRVKGKAVAEIVEEKSPYDPLRYCPKRLMNFKLLWLMDDPNESSTACVLPETPVTEPVRDKNSCCCFGKF